MIIAEKLLRTSLDARSPHAPQDERCATTFSTKIPIKTPHHHNSVSSKDTTHGNSDHNHRLYSKYDTTINAA
jgi:hypothetical protein